MMKIVTPNEQNRQNRLQCQLAIDSDQPELLDNLLMRHPELLHDQIECSILMKETATRAKLASTKVLVRHGCDINVPNWSSPWEPAPPLHEAVHSGNLAFVKWFVEHGANLHFAGLDGSRGSQAVQLAIIKGHADIALYLIDAGADVNSHNRHFVTALDFATRLGHHDLAAELRKRGGVTGPELPHYVPPPPKSAATRAVEKAHPVGVQERAWPADAGEDVAVRVGLGDGEGLLFTDGLSTVSVAGPGEEPRYAELVVFVDGDTLVDDDGVLLERLEDSASAWVADWLFKLAALPAGQGEWFGEEFGVVSNGDGPDPLTAGTDMTAWLLLPRKKPFVAFTADAGKPAVFYTLYPIHTAERDFVLTHGLIPLLEQFAREAVRDQVDLDPPSVI